MHYRWLYQPFRVIVSNFLAIFPLFVQVICLYPILTITILYLLQVLLVIVWPPLQLFWPNPLRNFLALNIFTLLQSPSNHLLAGELTYFKQHIIYLGLMWYFLLLRLRLEDYGNVRLSYSMRWSSISKKRFIVVLRQSDNWGSVKIRALLMLCVLVIWSYRYIVDPGTEEPFWGYTGRGLFSGFYVFLHDPIANFKFIFVPLYRFLEIGGYLLLGSAAAVTLPMFFILGHKRRNIIRSRQRTEESIKTTIGRWLAVSAPFVNIALIAILANISSVTGVGELSLNEEYVRLILLFLVFVCMYTLREIVLSIGTEPLPHEERLGRMFERFFLPLGGILIFSIFTISTLAPLQNLENNPLYKAAILESEIIGNFGEIFKWNIDIREDFHKRLIKLVKAEFRKYIFADKNCHPMELAFNKRLKQTQMFDIGMTCLQSQVATLYGLDQLPKLLGKDWQRHVNINQADLLEAYVNMYPNKRRELTENYQQLDSFKKLNFFAKRTFIAIHRLNNIKDIHKLDRESLDIYQRIKTKLKAEFDSFVGR